MLPKTLNKRQMEQLNDTTEAFINLFHNVEV